MRPSTLCRELLLLAAAGIGLASTSQAAQPHVDTGHFPVDVPTHQGPLRGYVVAGTDVDAWLGVPYAQPPVGALRWKPPVTAKVRSGVLNATAYGADCYQGTPKSSEDCLTLNIWRPRTGGTHLPVFVFIHGGSNTSGSAAYLADQTGWYTAAQHYNAIIVTLNYRLGAMGWFLHPALLSGDPEADSGNYGTLDQIKALSWVHNNIQFFGGDPANVTLAGQSAGSQNVSYLLHSPLAKDYFQKAIIESNFPGIRPVSAAYKSSKQVLYNLLVADKLAPDQASAKVYADTKMSAADIRKYFYSKSAADITNAYATAWWGGINWGDFYRSDIVAGNDFNAPPLIQGSVNRPEFVYAIGDGHVLPKGIQFADFSAGHVFPKPLIVGTTRNENDLWNSVWPFNYQQGKSLDALVAEAVNGTNPDYAYLQREFDRFGNHDAATFKANYAVTTHLIDELDTYYASTLAARNMVRNPEAAGMPVYVYRFDWGSDPHKDYAIPFQDAWTFYLGAHHAAELNFFYQRFYDLAPGDSTTAYQYTTANLPGRQALSRAIGSYLKNFIHTPDGVIQRRPLQPVAWKPWTRDAEQYLVLDADKSKAYLEMSSKQIPRDPAEIYAAHSMLDNPTARDFVEYYVLWSWNLNWYPNSSVGPFSTAPGPNPLFDPAHP